MAKANSAVDICNLALDHLNETAIQNIDNPTSRSEEICSRWYDNVRLACLRNHPWNFATKRAQLAALSTAPAFGYETQFQLPTDYVQLVSIGDDTVERLRDFEVEDGKLLINEAGPLSVRYIYDCKTVAQFDPLFVDYFAAELAVRVCKPITGNNATLAGLVALADKYGPKAFSKNGQESPVRRIERSRFKQSRRRYGNRYSNGRLDSSYD